MIIRQLEVRNFKGAKHAICAFGEQVKISGDNYTGKTSIAEAIVFALYGLNLDGSSRTDSLVNKDERKAEVSVTVEVDGRTFEIRREQTRQKKVLLNKVQVTQAEIESVIGPAENFMASFWPTHVLGMSDKEARNFFMKFVQLIEPGVVLSEMDQVFRDALQGLEMHDPESRKKELNAEIKEMQADLFYIEGAVATHQVTMQMDVPEKVDTQEMELPLEQVEKQLFAVSEKPALQDTSGLEDRIKEYERNMYTVLPPQPVLQDMAPFEQAVRDAECKLYEAERMPEPKAPDVTDIQHKIATLRAEYKVVKHELDQLAIPLQVGDTCPTCQQSFSEQAYALAMKKLDERKKAYEDELSEMEDAGGSLQAQLKAKQAAYKREVEAYQSQKEQKIAEATQAIEKAKADLQAVKKANADAMSQYEEQKQQVAAEWMQKVEEAKQALRDVQEGNNQLIVECERVEKQRKADLQQQRTELQQSLDERRKINAERESILQRKEEAAQAIEKMQASAENDKSVIERNELAIKAINEYVAKHAEMQAGQIEQYFTNVSIKLFDVTKTTGEIKPVFKLLYNDKPINILSLSERIRLGLEVAGMVKQVTGKVYPTFVDNAESITHFDAIPGQLFTATVVAGQSLQVE
ncbi:AAA domain-containing protein [Aneurinibacillus soli]|uniref:Nuclease SbcCD subunit C n=1 Tax=Aneurinibacillus soli TaxID=1500254 RepID=A0A0U5B472_9BACL|nr:AAA family ATPase [Aneurinibacillus soli]PYE64242.1 AAA domain-containing protein [Aneurinibacillus soli]BAU28191.1 chromosome segregation protein [Aneurinibacillus soli]